MKEVMSLVGYGCDHSASSERTALVSPETGVTSSRTAGLCRTGRWRQRSSRLLFGSRAQHSRVPGDCTGHLSERPTDRGWEEKGPQGQLRSQLRVFTHPVKHLRRTQIAFLLSRAYFRLGRPMNI